MPSDTASKATPEAARLEMGVIGPFASSPRWPRKVANRPSEVTEMALGWFAFRSTRQPLWQSHLIASGG